MKTDRPELFAYILLGIGIVLLIFTFIVALIQLVFGPSVQPSPNLSEALGEILGPIAVALIKVLYLGIMGWVGSIATIRGIQLLREMKLQTQTAQSQQKAAKGSSEKTA
jgi:hypothetical protein